MASPRLALCYGTRPQIIKASQLRRALAREWSVTAVDTGQHYDFSLNELLYRELEVAAPDHYLEVGSGSHAQQTAAILQRAETLLTGMKPAAVVVIGDTNSTLGCALAAVKCRIPVAHVEAGLRAADRLMPEEINRRLTDSMAGLLCAPSRAAADRLRREQPDSLIRMTGDVARDVLVSQLGRLPGREQVCAAASGKYLFATVHRAELTDRPAVLGALLAAISTLPVPTVLALHPRTAAALARAGLDAASRGNLVVIPAVGYLEAVALAQGAMAVLTDSGGVQREAFWLGVPCITLRAETEWHETVAVGANLLVDPARAPSDLPAAVARLLAGPRREWDRDVYGDGDAAGQVARAVGEWLA